LEARGGRVKKIAPKPAKASSRKLVFPTLVEFATDPHLCNLPLSPCQTMQLKAVDGLALTGEELDLFRLTTGRKEYVPRRYADVDLIGGAGAGKDSMFLTPLCLHAAFSFDKKHLHVGQTAVCSIVAQTMTGATITYEYIRETIKASPLMMSLVDEFRAEEIRLKNGVTIRVYPCTHKTQRGASILFAGMSELSFFRFEGSVDSDIEIEASIRRGMRFPQARIAKATTPYLPEGLAWKDHQKGWGKDNPRLLVFQVPTIVGYPGAKEWVEARRAEWDDVDRAAREFDAVFLDASIKGYIPRSEIEANVTHPGDLEYDSQWHYQAFADPSGLTENDHWTFCICHRESDRIVVDVLRGYDGKDETMMAGEHAALMREFHIADMKLVMDHYAGTLPGRIYLAHGIEAHYSPWDKSEAYVRTRRLIRRAVTGDRGLRLALPNHERLLSEFARLEVEYLAGGKVKVDHPKRPSAHDDYSNVIALGASILEDRNLRVQAQEIGGDGDDWRPTGAADHIYNRTLSANQDVNLDDIPEHEIAWMKQHGWLDLADPQYTPADLAKGRSRYRLAHPGGTPDRGTRERLRDGGIKDVLLSDEEAEIPERYRDSGWHQRRP
jgi:hypothetical protein